MTNPPLDPAPATNEDTPETLSIIEAACLIGALTHARAPHVATLHRWASQGVMNPAGRRIFLETLKFGRRRVTTREAVVRFASELAALVSPRTSTGPTARSAPVRHSTQSIRARRARVERALAALRQL